MLGHVVRPSLTALACLGLCFSGASQSAPKPLRATQVIALEAGGASAEDLVREISVRGLSFHPDGDYRAVLKTAGADSTVLAALDKAKITESAADEKPAKELVHQLGASAVVMKDKRYNEAGEKLRHVAESGAAEPEAAFVTGDLLRRMGAFEQAAAFYSRVLQLDPDFPEAHTKLSFILYKLDDSEGALREAKAALLQNPNNAEAHKNAGLALDEAQKFDAAILEYKEALRIKPDYSNVHFDLGIHYSQIHDYDDSIVEYRKAIALDPNNPDPHYNLAGSLSSRGEGAEAILELREAKRLNPDDPRIRQNLASEIAQLATA